MFGKKKEPAEPRDSEGYRLSSIKTCGICKSFYSTEKYKSCPACADWKGQPVPYI